MAVRVYIGVEQNDNRIDSGLNPTVNGLGKSFVDLMPDKFDIRIILRDQGNTAVLRSIINNDNFALARIVIEMKNNPTSINKISFEITILDILRMLKYDCESLFPQAISLLIIHNIVKLF